MRTKNLKNLTLVDLFTAKTIKGGINFNFDPPLRFTGDASKLVVLILNHLDDEATKPVRDVANGIIVSMGIKNAFETVAFSKGLKIDFDGVVWNKGNAFE